MPNKDKTMAYMVDPTMAAAGIQTPAAPISQTQAFSFDPPMQANMMSNAKPVFSPQAMGMAQTAFGTPTMRQASVGSAFPVSKAQMDAFGPGGSHENPGLLEAIKDADKSGKASDNSPNSFHQGRPHLPLSDKEKNMVVNPNFIAVKTEIVETANKPTKQKLTGYTAVKKDLKEKINKK